MTLSRTIRHRLAGCLLATALLLCVFTATAVLLDESSHDCEGENCPVCQLIHTAKDTLTLRNFTVPQAVSPSCAAVPRPLRHLAPRVTLPATSPVLLKIRLNN